MCKALVWSFAAVTGLPWLEIIKAFAPVLTALIAFLALRNWKRQDKAKREADFLDQLMEAAHAFIGAMPMPVTLVQLIKIGMESHIPMTRKNSDAMVAGAIEYIERQGAEDSKRLFEALAQARPPHTNLRTLAAKGNVFSFPAYSACQNAVSLLAWQFDRTQALATFIANPHWYWQNEEIIEQLKKLMAIDAEDIRMHLSKHNADIITYVGKAYSRLYS